MTTKHEELRKLAEAEKNAVDAYYAVPAGYIEEAKKADLAVKAFHKEATPAKILELLDEIKEQRRLLEIAEEALQNAQAGNPCPLFKESYEIITAHLRQHEGETQ